jgi:hypothetical protein
LYHPNSFCVELAFNLYYRKVNYWPVKKYIYIYEKERSKENYGIWQGKRE